MSLKAIVGAHVFTGTGWRDRAAVLMRDRAIEDVVDETSLNRRKGFVVETLPPGTVLAPGFIDVQVNGGGGVLLNDAPDLATIRCMTDAHRRYGGTTGMLPTLITDVPQKMQALAAVAAQAMTIPGVLGFHLEGPFLNIARKGVHREEFIRVPSAEDVRLMRAFAAFGTSLVTLAPETAGNAAIESLAAAGLKICAGHCEPTFGAMRDAADHGLSGITHLYNALAPLGGRAPGVIGAAFDDRRLYCGLIADGHHVNPSNVRLAYTVKGRDRVMLVTDAMATSASEATSFVLQGRKIDLIGGRLTAGPDTLAGAHLTMLEAVRRMIGITGCNVGEALMMASRTPAEYLGRGKTHGRIEAGFAADMVAYDPKAWKVVATWISGARGAGISVPAADR
jgi:N-acetylglucosamine-6-phosphate deacetylase